MKTLSIVGRLGQDPEVKFANSGTAILNLSVACDYQKKADGGGYERATLWVRVIVFGKRAESLQKILLKGMRVATSGDLQLNEFTNREGEKRTTVELIANDVEPLFDKKEGGQESRPSNGGGQRPAGNAGRERFAPPAQSRGYGADDGAVDDDIPF